MISLVLSMVLAAPFPLPAVDGKALAVTDGQKVFRLPMRFEKVKQFYAAQLGDGATAVEKSVEGKRVLTLTAKGKAESWTKALVREGEVDVTIEVTPVMRLTEEQITGQGGPLVQFVIGRSADVQKAMDAIDQKHVEQIRK
jgi:hypothetical protein